MRYIILFLSAIVIFASCKEKDPTVPDSREDKLRTGKWRVLDIRYTFRDSFGVDSVVAITLDECKLDDNIEFQKNLNGVHNTNDNRCYNNEWAQYAFTWELSHNDSALGLYNLDDYFLGVPNISGTFTEFSDSKFTVKTLNVLPSFNYFPRITDTFKYARVDFIK